MVTDINVCGALPAVLPALGKPERLPPVPEFG
jgi:hypothetical protein